MRGSRLKLQKTKSKSQIFEFCGEKSTE